MSDLIVIVYPTVTRAEEVRKYLAELQKEYFIALDNAVIATRSKDGKIKLDQLMNTTATSAVSSSFWGLFIGALFLNPLLGATKGVPSRALADALTDVGVRDSFVRKLAANLKPGNGALFLLFNIMTADKILEDIESFGGIVIKTSLDETKDEVLREALQRAKLRDKRARSARRS